MFDEHQRLQQRINALDDFITSDTFEAIDSYDKTLLQRQHAAMTDYNAILVQRLQRF